MTDKQKRIARALRTLEKEWPDDGTMIFANGHFLYLCTKHPEAGGQELAAFDIPNDGGDPDWGTQQPAEKRLAKFAPPKRFTS